MRYLIQPIDQIIFLKLWVKILLKIKKWLKSKNLSGKYSQFKTASKSAFQKLGEANGDLFGNKIADKITKSSNYHNKTIQKHGQLQMTMIKVFLKKDIYIYIYIYI